MKDKRDIILEFHSSPDAILNALHQAGWQIIPKTLSGGASLSPSDGKPDSNMSLGVTPPSQFRAMQELIAAVIEKSEKEIAVLERMLRDREEILQRIKRTTGDKFQRLLSGGVSKQTERQA